MTEICLLHFNDVKSIGSSTSDNHKNSTRRANEDAAHSRDAISGAAARFSTLVKSFNSPLVLFSGDALNSSSPLSTITKGLHMAPILNQLSTAVGIMGNVSVYNIVLIM